MRSVEHLGRSSKAKNPINAKKVKCDGRTDGPTKRGVQSRSTRLKKGKTGKIFCLYVSKCRSAYSIKTGFLTTHVSFSFSTKKETCLTIYKWQTQPPHNPFQASTKRVTSLCRVQYEIKLTFWLHGPKKSTEKKISILCS